MDDGSTDGTREKLAAWDGRDGVRVILHPDNMGKGRAVRTAIEAARGDILIIQDADLEYDPAEYPRLLAPIEAGRADVVFGSRFSGSAEHRVQNFWHQQGNRLLTLISNVFTGPERLGHGDLLQGVPPPRRAAARPRVDGIRRRRRDHGQGRARRIPGLRGAGLVLRPLAGGGQEDPPEGRLLRARALACATRSVAGRSGVEARGGPGGGDRAHRSRAPRRAGPHAARLALGRRADSHPRGVSRGLRPYRDRQHRASAPDEGARGPRASPRCRCRRPPSTSRWASASRPTATPSSSRIGSRPTRSPRRRARRFSRVFAALLLDSSSSRRARGTATARRSSPWRSARSIRISIAHAGVVHTDLGAALAFLATVLAWDRAWREPSAGRVTVGAGVVLGLAGDEVLRRLPASRSCSCRRSSGAATRERPGRAARSRRRRSGRPSLAVGRGRRVRRLRGRDLAHGPRPSSAQVIHEMVAGRGAPGLSARSRGSWTSRRRSRITSAASPRSRGRTPSAAASTISSERSGWRDFRSISSWRSSRRARSPSSW